MSFRQLHFKFGVLLFSRTKLEPFSALSFLVFRCFAKTACNVGRNNREHLAQVLSERAHEVGICFVIFFSRGHDTELWTVSIYMRSTEEAFFMTTILLKGLTTVPGICQSPGRPRLIFHVVAHFELGFLRSIFYQYILSLSFMT